MLVYCASSLIIYSRVESFVDTFDLIFGEKLVPAAEELESLLNDESLKCSNATD